MRAHTVWQGAACTAATLSAWSPDADRALPPCDPVRAWLRMGFVISESRGESASNPHICRYTVPYTSRGLRRLGSCVRARVSSGVARDRERGHAPCACHAGILPGSGMASNEIIVLPARTKQSPPRPKVRTKQSPQNFNVERVAVMVNTALRSLKVERSPAVTRCGQYDVACAGGGAGGSVGSYSCSAPHLHLAQRAPRYGEGRDCNPYLGPIRHYDFICFNCLGTWMGGWGVSPISTRLHHTFRTRTTGHLGSPTRLWVSCGCVPAPPGVSCYHELVTGFSPVLYRLQ
jgi:hypothetical protein